MNFINEKQLPYVQMIHGITDDMIYKYMVLAQPNHATEMNDNMAAIYGKNKTVYASFPSFYIVQTVLYCSLLVTLYFT
jgi:hypothetical protein